MSCTFHGGVTVTVEAALSASTGSYGVWDAGLWDTATWGPDEIWTDISDWVISFSSRRRFSREVSTWEAGTFTVVLRNEDGRFSPDNLDGPYVAAGVTGIRPWRPIRITATFEGVTYPIYRGYALDWDEEWVEASPGDGAAIVTVPCTDEFGSLAGYDGYATSEQGEGESTGARVHRVLDAAGHTGSRNIDTGRMTVQATTLAANALTELKLVADSEGGALYVDADGTVVFEAYTALIEGARSNAVQATWGDDGVDLPYHGVKTAYNGDGIINKAAFARVGGEVQVAVDNTSRALYGDKQYSRTDLVTQSDLQVEAIAALQVALRATPERRITHLVVKPSVEADLFMPAVLGARVRDLWRVKRTPPGGYLIDQFVHVSGISHVVTGDVWQTTFEFASATPYLAYTSSLWDTGTWDSAVWFY